MAVRDIFAKRGNSVPPKDVFTYDVLPKPLKIQIVHIWTSTLGLANDDDPYAMEPAWSFIAWKSITAGLARELGMMRLADRENPCEEAFQFLLNRPQPVVKEELSLIEWSFATIDTHLRDNYWTFANRGITTQTPDDAIEELNHRFLEHGVGYQYANRKIIRLDTTYAHAEVVRPALTVLSNPVFRNAQEEFLRAHEAYREGRYSDSLNESLKAFESTMKIICAKKGWAFDQNDTASKLIGILLGNGLVSSSNQTQLNGLKALLESGTPMARNKNSGHGQGVVAVTVPDYLAAYGLQTAAANISMLVAAYESSK